MKQNRHTNKIGLLAVSVVLLAGAVVLGLTGCSDDQGTTKPNEPPVLGMINPSNKSAEQPVVPNLQWECEDPENDQVRFDLFLGGEFPLPVVAERLTACQFTPDSLAWGARYFWYVVAKDQHQNVVQSETWQFETKRGLKYSISPSSLVVDFGYVRVGESKDTIFTIVNTGSIRLDGEVTSSCKDLEIESGKYYQIAPGQSHAVRLQFTPSVEGPQNCVVDLGNNVGADLICNGNGIADKCLVTPATLDFGEVGVGKSVVENVTLMNWGTFTIVGELTESCDDYRVISGGTYQLAPGASKTFAIEFAPKTTGTKTCEITTGQTACNKIACTGIGASAGCSIYPETIDFGEVQLGESAEAEFTITNTGSTFLTGAITSCEDFSIISGATYSIAPGQVQIVKVRFNPQSAGTKRCVINTGHDACHDVVAVAEVAAQSCEVAPTTLDFGYVAIGESRDLEFVISNPGKAVLNGTISSTSQEFVIVGDRTYNISPGGNQSITVRFTPSSQNQVTATIDLGEAVCEDVQCQGAGGTRSVSVQPTELDFGKVALGDLEYLTFVIKNTGSVSVNDSVLNPCDIIGFYPGQKSCQQFSISSGKHYQLQPGGEHIVRVSFGPLSAGDDSTTIHVGRLTDETVFCRATGFDPGLWNGLPPEEPSVKDPGQPGIQPISPPDTIENGDWICEEQTMRMGYYEEEYAKFDPNAEIVWPGQLLQGQSIHGPTPERIIARRGPGCIVINNITGTEISHFCMPEVTMKDVFEGANEIIRGQQGLFPARLDFEYFRVRNWAEVSYHLSMNTSFWPIFKSSWGFDFEGNYEKTVFLVKLHQSFYTLMFERPTDLPAIFHPEVTLQDMAPFMGPGNPPCFISQVTYGRVFYLLIESTESKERMEAAINTSFLGIGFDGKGGGVNELEGFHLHVHAIGGKQDEVFNAVNSGVQTTLDFMDHIRDAADITTGVPLSYSVRSVRSDKLVKNADATEYTVRSCQSFTIVHINPDELGPFCAYESRPSTGDSFEHHRPEITCRVSLEISRDSTKVVGKFYIHAKEKQPGDKTWGEGHYEDNIYVVDPGYRILELNMNHASIKYEDLDKDWEEIMEQLGKFRVLGETNNEDLCNASNQCSDTIDRTKFFFDCNELTIRLRKE